MTTKPSVIPDGTKWCPACKQLRGHMDFASDAARKDGLRSKCKPCDHRARSRLNLRKNPDMIARHIAKSEEWVKRISEIQTTAKAKGSAAKAEAEAIRTLNLSAMIAASAARTALRT